MCTPTLQDLPEGSAKQKKSKIWQAIFCVVKKAITEKKPLEADAKTIHVLAELRNRHPHQTFSEDKVRAQLHNFKACVRANSIKRSGAASFRAEDLRYDIDALGDPYHRSRHVA